jgi:hypothetical protein
MRILTKPLTIGSFDSLACALCRTVACVPLPWCCRDQPALLFGPSGSSDVAIDGRGTCFSPSYGWIVANHCWGNGRVYSFLASCLLLAVCTDLEGSESNVGWSPALARDKPRPAFWVHERWQAFPSAGLASCRNLEYMLKATTILCDVLLWPAYCLYAISFLSFSKHV